MTTPAAQETSGRTPSEAELDRIAPSSAGGREVRIGIFVLLGIFAIFAVLFLLTDPATFRGRYVIGTEVVDAGGIRRGDPVQMRGVNIGRVDQFDLSEGGVMIGLEIEGRWLIPIDSRARLAGADLLGGRTVEIIPGSAVESIPAGGLLPGEAVDGLMEVAEDLGNEARVALDRIGTLLADSAIASVHASISEMEELLTALTEVTVEQRSELARISSSIGRSADRVEDLVGREEIDRSLARADSTLVELQAAGGSLARATESLDRVMGRIDRGEGTLGRLTTDDEIYESINATLEEVRALTRDIRENPGRFFRISIF